MNDFLNIMKVILLFVITACVPASLIALVRIAEALEIIARN